MTGTVTPSRGRLRSASPRCAAACGLACGGPPPRPGLRRTSLGSASLRAPLAARCARRRACEPRGCGGTTWNGRRSGTVSDRPGPDALRRGSRPEPREGPRAHRGGGPARGAHRLPAGAVPLALLLPERGRRALRAGGADPGPVDGAPRRWRPRCGVAIVASLFEKRAAGLYHNTAVAIDRTAGSRPLPQDAHPRRSALLREVLLHAGRPRLPLLRARARRSRVAGVLGPVVSRGGAADGAGGRRDPLLSDGDRLAVDESARWTPRSTTPGRRSSARTRSRTASSWRR